MSQANVEIVRHAWEAHKSRDNEAAFQLYAQEIEIHSAFGEVYRGLGGVQEYFRSSLGAMDLIGAAVEEWIDAGDNVIAVMHISARGRTSGAPVEQHQFHVWTVRQGRLARLDVYHDRSQALEAVGLAE
jgi:uncharacterized protein